MLENVLFFYSYSTNRHERWAVCHQTLAFVIFLCWSLTILLSNFCWWGCKVCYFSPAQVTLVTLLISHYWFLKAVQLYRA